MMKDPMANTVVLRKVKDTLKDSVFEQLQWAIDALKVGNYWDAKHSPLELTYKPTGQKIIFRGADKPKKIKSIKFSKGYCKFIWYEELDEFSGMAEIRNINQSLMRGGPEYFAFYS
jgi:PBSX family phage terminase large subunit